jgi:hypothetical protein
MISSLREAPLPRLNSLPAALSAEGALCIELQEGIPVIRASSSVQSRIENLLGRQQESGLSESESEELDRYEEIDDYLSFLNRVARNFYEAQQINATCATRISD